MIRIELEGCETACCGDLAVSSRKGPICTLARKLVAAGSSEDEEVGVFRGETECFRRYPLRKWAGLSISEPDRGFTTVRLVPYRPHPMAA